MTILESYAEQIVKIINQERKRRLLEKNDITKGYAEIFYDTVTFERKKLCNEQFSMILPIFFDVMKEEYVALKYCAENRPEFIYTNKELNINITFSFLCKKEITTDILEMQKEIEKEIKQINTDIVLIEKDILQTEEGTDIVHFLFPLDIKDTTLLQEFFIFSVNEKWVIGTFHCPYTQKRDWVNIIKQMLLSIHLEE